MMKVLNTLAAILVHWTWGVVQNAAGLAVFLVNMRKRHYIYRNTVVTEWDSPNSSMGLGMFIFLGRNDTKNTRILAHEYGHTIQSMILGPFFLPAVALPSLVWANSRILVRYRKKRGLGYYRFYTERWADHIAERKLGKSPESDKKSLHNPGTL